MLSCLVRQHKYELFHALFYSPLSIAPAYHTMSILSITFLVYQPFELESVMAVSKGTAVPLLTTRVWVLYGGDGVVSTGTGLLSAGVGVRRGVAGSLSNWVGVQFA